MSNTIKSTLLSVALSLTNGKFDEATTRAIIRRKLADVPAEIQVATRAKIEEVLAKVDPAQHAKVKVTFYVPKVELE